MKLRIADFIIDIRMFAPILPESYIPFFIHTENIDIISHFTDEEWEEEQKKMGIHRRPKVAADYCTARKIAETLPCFDAFVLHSACFDVDGVGVAFAAHSGTGKTTHMLLWKELLGDRMTIVNGDKPIVRFFDNAADLETKNPVGNFVGDDAHIVPQDRAQINGTMWASSPTDKNLTRNQPFAYGTPWNGKEHLGCNMRTPLRHICFIERAAENSCEPMTDRSDAVNRIFNQVYMPKDPMAAAKTIGLIDRLMKSCSLWIIKCNMEPSAAEVAYRTIFEKTLDPRGTM